MTWRRVLLVAWVPLWKQKCNIPAHQLDAYWIAVVNQVYVVPAVCQLWQSIGPRDISMDDGSMLSCYN